jgi:hypothetical protein
MNRQDDEQLVPPFDPQERFNGLVHIEKEFWKHKKLDEFTREEWELLCDGCGKCCLNKLDIKGKTHFTNVRCRFLDCKTCLCQVYEHRFEAMDDCRDIDLAAVREKPRWLPKTCAYWLVDNGFDLPSWHPLKTGKAASVHQAGASLQGRELINETEVDDFENHLVDWQDL